MRNTSEETLLFSNYGCDVIQRGTRYYVRYESGEVVSRIEENEISYSEVNKIRKSEEEAYQVILAAQERKELQKKKTIAQYLKAWIEPFELMITLLFIVLWNGLKNQFKVYTVASLLLASSISCFFYLFPGYQLLSLTSVAILIISFLTTKKYFSKRQEFYEIFGNEVISNRSFELVIQIGWIGVVSLTILVHLLNF